MSKGQLSKTIIYIFPSLSNLCFLFPFTSLIDEISTHSCEIGIKLDVSLELFRMPKPDERYLVSPVAQVILIQVKSAEDEEFESSDITRVYKTLDF